jgi:hypothetical protein
MREGAVEMAWFARISRTYLGHMSLDAKRPVDAAVVGEQAVLLLILALCSWTSVHTLLTTPFVNSEVFFNETKPLRPDLKGMGPFLRLVELGPSRTSGMLLRQLPATN